MSKQYCIDNNLTGQPTTSPEMRVFCQRPGNHDEDGNPIYFTEQSHKINCDVNAIIKKYDKTGLISHISRFEAQFGDLSGNDFKTMTDKIINANNQFNNLPSEIRNRFQNNPEELLRFMENPLNRDEAIDLGLINRKWTPDTDGLGEHVKEGQNVEQPKIPDELPN